MLWRKADWQSKVKLAQKTESGKQNSRFGGKIQMYRQVTLDVTGY
jgi:hypothetical protein